MEKYLKILNKLGPIYHSYFGIHPEEHNLDHVYIWTYINSVNINDLIADGAMIFDENDDIICETVLNNPNKIDEIAVVYDYKKLIKESKTKLPYKTIRIKFNGRVHDFWYNIPDKWYNKPSRLWKDGQYIPYLKKYVLPYLKTRPYIIVVKPFMEVKLKAKKKGDKLTIDDVLFATRALMADETRTVNGGYKILNVSKDRLTLEPDIDNYST